jgi:hypothetical protein
MLFNRNHVLHHATMPGEYCFPVCAWLAAMDYTWNNDGFVNCYEPWSGHYDVTPSLWAVAHTTQFTAPGWIYLAGTGCGLLPGGGSYVTLRAPALVKGVCDFSIVIETKDATNDQTLNFSLAGPLSPGLRHVWESYGTNDATWFINRKGRLSANTGRSFGITVRPNSIVSITTTAGQHKGTFHNIPPSSPFPAAYSEDFESYADHETPRYLSDYYGAFAVTTDSDPAHHKCLQQQITNPVIKWWRLDDRNRTQTLIGNKDWKNYEASVEGKMDTGGFVELGARCVPERDDQLIGPHLRVTLDGRWTLEDSNGAVLASGRVPGFKGTEWHRYGLRCAGQCVAGSIDGAEKAVATTIEAQGAVYLATSRNLTEFDNLSIVPLSEPGPGPASFLSTVTFGSTRNDFTGDMGMKISIGSEDVPVVELGRAYAHGNARAHILKLTRASDGAVLASAQISMAAGVPDVRGFKHARLRAPVVLASNTAYYVTSSETAGGDSWYEPGESAAASDTDAKIQGVYHQKEGWSENEPGHCAGINLKYLCDSFGSRVTLGTARTNFSGEVGMKVTVGRLPLTVTQLGRSFLPGNSHTHTVKITRARDNIVLSQAEIDLSSGAPDWRGFKYAALPQPVTLAPNTAYYITTMEKDSSDSWHDVEDSTILTDTDAAIRGVYHEGGVWHEMTPGHFYGGLNLRIVPTAPLSP